LPKKEALKHHESVIQHNSPYIFEKGHPGRRLASGGSKIPDKCARCFYFFSKHDLCFINVHIIFMMLFQINLHIRSGLPMELIAAKIQLPPVIDLIPLLCSMATVDEFPPQSE